MCLNKQTTSGLRVLLFQGNTLPLYGCFCTGKAWVPFLDTKRIKESIHSFILKLSVFVHLCKLFTVEKFTWYFTYIYSCLQEGQKFNLGTYSQAHIKESCTQEVWAFMSFIVGLEFLLMGRSWFKGHWKYLH